MKRSIINQYDQLQEKLSGYVAMLNFRYMNLCIKAEEASLLPVTVNIEGVGKKLEQVSVIGKKDDYHFMVVPHIDEDMRAVGMGIAMVHPEFKQDVESLHIEAHDAEGNPMDRDVPYILLTMPEVDDERYDFLKNAVDIFYKDCKAKMEKAVMQATGTIAMYSVGEPAEEIEQMGKAVDKLKDEKNQKREEIREEKLKEIEDAHNKWLAEQAQKNPQNNASGEGAGQSLRLTPDDNEY